MLLKDGTERNIESISLIDAVLPEVIEQRKQGALKGSQMKVEAHGPNGEEGISQHMISVFIHDIFSLVFNFIFSLQCFDTVGLLWERQRPSSLDKSSCHSFQRFILLLVCVSLTIIGQPRNSVLIHRV